MIFAVFSDHFSAIETTRDFGVNSPTITTRIVEIPVAITVENTVGCPLPIVVIAKEVPTEATIILKRFPTNNNVPNNLSYFSIIFRSREALRFPLLDKCLIL